MTLVFHFCHMSSVRGTSDGGGPVTRKRVPDREEQGKPINDARHGRCHPLNNFLGPEGDTVTVDEQLLNTEYWLNALSCDIMCA